MPRHSAARFALFLAIGVTSCSTVPIDDALTAAYSVEECRSCSEWNEAQEPVRIFGNTFYVGTRGLGAVLITSDDGHVLIDGGLPNSAPHLLENVRALGIDVRDIKLILNSHAHYDHAGGIAAVQHASGAAVAASEASASVLEHGTSASDDPQFGVLLRYPPVKGVRRLRDGDTVRVGRLALTAHLTPGHTAGGTTWTWQSCDAVRCLDLVYADSQTPVSADGFLFSRNATYPGAVADFERSHRVLEELACDILITPHPAASSFWERREAGFVDDAACKRYAEAARRLLARRLEREAQAPTP